MESLVDSGKAKSIGINTTPLLLHYGLFSRLIQLQHLEDEAHLRSRSNSSGCEPDRAASVSFPFSREPTPY